MTLSFWTVVSTTLTFFLCNFFSASPMVGAVPLLVTPGSVSNMLVTKNTTLNATTPAGRWFAPFSPPSSYLKMALVNKLSSNNVKAYVTGLNANNQLVFLNKNGAWYFPETNSGTPVPLNDNDISIPLGGQGSTTYATIPGYLSSSRVWFADGELRFSVVATPNGPGLVEPAAVNPNDPNSELNYGFGELTWTQNGGIFADISFVDFVGMPIGIELTTTDGNPRQQALGLVHDAVPRVCSDLQEQTKKDGQPWSQECAYTLSGQLIRVLAPIDVLSTLPNSWKYYFDNLIDNFFIFYNFVPLVIDTQMGAGLVTCRANRKTQTLSCDGDNRVYTRPSAEDIFGCNSGPFGFAPGDNAVHYAVVPRLCAAFNRGTLFAPGGRTQPSLLPDAYYPWWTSASNLYSKIVHQYEWNGKGYAFSYDDVSPREELNVAGVVASGSPDTLSFIIGGYDL